MKYKTKIEKVEMELINNNQILELQQHPSIKKAAVLLKKGEVVAFPTETVYGLGAVAT